MSVILLGVQESRPLLPLLALLDLGHNELTELPSLLHLPRMESLNMRANRISRVTGQFQVRRKL